MAKSNTMFTALLRNPLSFAILVLCVVILVVWFDYKATISRSLPAAAAGISTSGSLPAVSESSEPPPIELSPPGAQPQIMNQFGAGESGQQSGAPAIDALVGRLEEKVKSDPGNLNNRILLAQTYKELGRSPDALQVLRKVHDEEPENSRANLVLASILSQSDDANDLQEALQLLEQVTKDITVQPYLIHMYRGDAFIRQKNHEEALTNWKEALASMPESDARYADLEKKVMELTNTSSSASTPGS